MAFLVDREVRLLLVAIGERWQYLKPKRNVPAAFAARDPPAKWNPHHMVITDHPSRIVNGVVHPSPFEKDLVMHLLAIQPRRPKEHAYG